MRRQYLTVICGFFLQAAAALGTESLSTKTTQADIHAALEQCRQSGRLILCDLSLTSEELNRLLWRKEVVRNVTQLVINQHNPPLGVLPNLGHLKKLLYLSSSAGITATGSFPENIEIIRLTYNMLEAPPDIRGLTKVLVLDLDQNDLKEIDAETLQWHLQQQFTLEVKGNYSLRLDESYLTKIFALQAASGKRLLNTSISVVFSCRDLATKDALISMIGQGGFPNQIPLPPAKSAGSAKIIYLGGREAVCSRLIASLCPAISMVFNSSNEVAINEEKLREQGVFVTNFPLQDTPDQQVNFGEYTQLLHASLQQGEAILVNCGMGISRSASIVVAYLVRYQEMNLAEALLYVHQQRKKINPNFGFIAQLMLFENIFYEGRAPNSYSQEEIDLLLNTFYAAKARERGILANDPSYAKRRQIIREQILERLIVLNCHEVTERDNSSRKACQEE